MVITCLGERFGINCPSAFLKILKLPSKTRAISKTNNNDFLFFTSLIVCTQRDDQNCKHQGSRKEMKGAISNMQESACSEIYEDATHF